MPTAFQIEDVSKAIKFFQRIKLPIKTVHPLEVRTDTFFAGCWIENNRLHLCPEIVDVGELLHEAGHYCITPKSLRSQITLEISKECYPPLGLLSMAGDLAAEAWAVAAATAANIPEIAVFENGFSGKGMQVYISFLNKKHPGFALLKILGMSKKWGKCKQWYIPDNIYFSDSHADLYKMFSLCERWEVENISLFLKKQLEMSETNLKNCVKL